MKKRYILFAVIINIIGIGVIPLNSYIFFIPEYVTIIISLLILIVVTLLCIRSKGKKILKFIVTSITLVNILAMLFLSYCNPYWNSMKNKWYLDTKRYDYELSYDEEKEDIDYVMHYLKKDHPLFIEELPDEVNASYDSAIKDLKDADKIDVILLNRKIQSILTILGDAHTCSYPFYEEVHYLKDKKYREENGEILIKVNGIELSELFKEKSDLYSYEVESWGMVQLEQDLSTLQGLYLLGINLDNGVTYTYVDKNNEEHNKIYNIDDFVTWDEYEKDKNSFVYYSIHKENNIATLTLKECNFNDEYTSCLKNMFTEVKEFGIDNVAVDIRDNAGGNSYVVNEFLKYINIDMYNTGSNIMRRGIFKFNSGDGVEENMKYANLLFNGQIYLLTSSKSFSSAMIFAEYIKDNNLGIIIGEAPGNTPTGYGDVATFMLPNSKLYVQISTKEFFRADKNSTDILVTPDVGCKNESSMDVLYSIINN